METVYKPPNILRLPGISLKDYVPVEDVADARLLDPGTDGAPPEPDDPAPESAHPFDKIPRVFTGLEDWPHRTNLRCWVCTFTFDDRPKFVPTHVREGEGAASIEFGVHGNMCTFNCAERWIETFLSGRANEEERWRAQENLCLVYFIFTGRRVARIKAGPDKTELRQYGGEWDEDTFWRRLRELDPVAGLRDHTPGSVVPERERVRSVLAAVASRAAIGAAPALRALAASPDALGAQKAVPGEPLTVSSRSVWGVCGLPPCAPPALLAPASATKNNVPALDDLRCDSIAIEAPTARGGSPPDSGGGRDALASCDDDLEALLAARDSGDDGGCGADDGSSDANDDGADEDTATSGSTSGSDGTVDSAVDSAAGIGVAGADASSPVSAARAAASAAVAAAAVAAAAVAIAPAIAPAAGGLSDADVDDMLADLGVF